MQEKPLTPYQKTQIAAATLLGLAVTAVAVAAFALRGRVAVVKDPSLAAAAPAAAASLAPLRDAVADRPATAALVHATAVTLDKSWLSAAPKPAAKPSADDLARERLLADASGASAARVERLRRDGLSWTAIARRLGWPKRSARLFAKTGVLVGQRLARR